ncbi:Uncharacterised protein [Chlamydia abortus]|nr:Uncharacterised protein [Chlamydia abortus]
MDLLIFHDFQFSCHIPRPTVEFLNFPPFSVFLAIFHVLKYVFLIFRDFQFSHRIPGPTVCISHFSRFSVISSFFKSSSGNFSFSMIFSFSRPTVFLIFHDFHFSCHIPCPTVYISKFTPFSVFLAIFLS